MRNTLLASLAIIAGAAVTWIAVWDGDTPPVTPGVATWGEDDAEPVEIVDAVSESGFGEQPEIGREAVTGLAAPELPGTLDLQIRGRVVDASTMPIAGALVALEVRRGGRGRRGPGADTSRIRKSVTTGEDGRFEFSGPAAASSRVELLVTHEHFAPHVEIANDRFDRNTGVWDVGDLAIAIGARLLGRVTDVSGNGIGGAEVQVEPQPGNRLAWSSARERVEFVTRTDGAGHYRFEHLAAGIYRIRASAHGLQRGWLPSPIEAENGEEERVAPIVLHPGRVLTGTVYDPNGGPVAGAQVRIGGRRGRGDRARTDDDGRFEFAHLDPSTFELTVEADGFLTWKQPELDPTLTRDVVVNLEAGLVITGRVLDAASGAPVLAYAAQIERVRPLDDGSDQRVRAIADLRQRLETMSIDSAQNTQTRARVLARARDLEREVAEIDRRRAMETRFRASPGRQRKDLGPVETRANGAFRFDGLDEGVYVVHVASPSHQVTRSSEIELRRGSGPHEIAVTVAAGMTVRGEVVAAADRTPISGAHVELLAVREGRPDAARGPSGPPGVERIRQAFPDPAPRGDRVMDASTDAEGRFEFEHAPTGRYFLSVRSAGCTTWRSEPFELVGDRTDFRIDLQRAARISGRVSGIPPGRESEVRIVAFAGFGRGRMQNTRPEPDGTYLFRDVQPGNYLVRAFVGDMRSYAITAMAELEASTAGFDLVVQAGGEYSLDVVVDIPPVGSVAGTVMRNGSPASRYRVSLRPTQSDALSTRFTRQLSSRVDEFGKFEITGAVAGNYQLVVQSGRHEVHRERVLVVAESTARVDVHVVSGALSGTVVAPDGADAESLDGSLTVLFGVAGVMPDDLRRFERENPSRRVRVSDGAFSSDDVPAGPALLVLQIRGRKDSLLETTITAGQSRVQITAGPVIGQ